MKTLKKHFPLCLVVGMVVMLWMLIVGQHTAEARNTLQTRLVQEREPLADLNAKIEQLQSKQNQLRELDQRCSAYQIQLPTVDQFESILTSVKQLAEVNALTMEPAKSQPAPPLLGVSRRMVQLHVRGSFNALYEFLTQLETTSCSLLVQGFELKRRGNTDADLSANITVELLFRNKEINTIVGGAK